MINFLNQVMNLKEEFKEAQGWVKESLNFDINKVIIIFIIMIIAIMINNPDHHDDNQGCELV